MLSARTSTSATWTKPSSCAIPSASCAGAYAGVEHEIAEGRWLRLDAIGMRLTGSENLSAVEWLYLKLALIGGGMRHARYVMIDEVQDYGAAQLACAWRVTSARRIS